MTKEIVKRKLKQEMINQNPIKESTDYHAYMLYKKCLYYESVIRSENINMGELPLD